MSNELEAAAVASAGEFVRRPPNKHTRPVGAPCANCATPLQGPWCHACGQSGEDFHRSILRLCGEMVEGLLHMDGRLWRTLPDLMARPARLTRAYLDGHRAPQIPPLRLFLVVLLMIFLVGGVTSQRGVRLVRPGAATVRQTSARPLEQLSPEERANIVESLSHGRSSIDLGKSNQAAADWLKDRLSRTLADPERFYLILEQWAERFAILMLPVSALLLSMLFVFQRRFYLFDHTIFSLHSLSVMGIAIIAAMLLSTVLDDSAFALLLPAPVHLFLHMRGVYRTSVLGTLIRMALLFAGSVIAAAILFVGLIAVGLNGMGA
ncbi:MAG: hypothetical protein JWO83_3140 [Caulobacteraceae bacterium]|nr:hypothetical protein [Caulobacteraceae bacterium]